MSAGDVAGAGGCSAALTGALGAALVAMVARADDGEWREAGGAVAQADRLHQRLTELASQDAAVFSAASALLAQVHAARQDHSGERDRRLADALLEAAVVPLKIAESAADVAALAAWTAENAGQRLRADALVAVRLAEAAADAAATLVEINLVVRADDELAVRARRAATAAHHSRSAAAASS
jgi:formiminotetrahydrofolate cyclodeaminase